MLILVINCGSSSVKYDLYDAGEEVSLFKGSIERIGEEVSVLSYKAGTTERVLEDIQCPDHFQAIGFIRDVLVDPKKGVLSGINEVSGVGHRAVHGGEHFSSSVIIDSEVLDNISKYSELAPLHNPASLNGIKGSMKIFSDIPHIAVFDTAFHQSMPDYAFRYGLPYELYEKYGIRKYGFHGISHRYVSRKAAELTGIPYEDANIISVHLGNGCSITAVSGGKSIDTSMGFTPLEGLVMGTRSGDIDPAVVTFLIDKEEFDTEQVKELLNKKSGLLGISGISNDMRDIIKARDKGDERAILAYKIFTYRIKKYIGAYAAVLGKVNAVVFTGGIGENVPGIMDELKEQLSSLLGGGTQFLKVATNEELLIAQDTEKLVREGSRVKGGTDR